MKSADYAPYAKKDLISQTSNVEHDTIQTLHRFKLGTARAFYETAHMIKGSSVEPWGLDAMYLGSTIVLLIGSSEYSG